jgi:hypothetical protein
MRKLDEFNDDYNNYRTHSALSGQPPDSYSQPPTKALADINGYAWRQLCHSSDTFGRASGLPDTRRSNATP